jgi:hypothetical protein
LCEETYQTEALDGAARQGKEALISAIRTHNMYPPSHFADQIATAIMNIIAEQGDQSAELLFDDKELFLKPVEEKAPAEAEVEEDEEESDTTVEMDDLLEDNIEEDYEEDKKIIQNLKGGGSKVEDESDSASGD